MSKLLLALDFMVGVADQPYAAAATKCAAIAVNAARKNGIAIVYTKVGFLAGYPEVSPRNKVFSQFIGSGQLIGPSSRLIDGIASGEGETVVDKKRFSAFAGSGLWTIVRASGATSIALCGLSTSGVILSTALELIDADFDVTVLSDACADPEAGLHKVILDSVLGPRATVYSVQQWISELTAAEASRR